MKKRDRASWTNGIFRVIGIAVAVLLLIVIGRYGIYADTSKANDENEKVSVIVEMDKAPILASYSSDEIKAFTKKEFSTINDLTNESISEHDKVVALMADEGIHVKKTRDYTLVYNGMAVNVPAEQTDAIADISGVKRVHKDETLHANLDESVPLIEAPETWKESDEEGNLVTGEGVTVAIIDTGIDYTHKDLGAGMGDNYKVLGGYDYVHNDPDPMDDNGHGTHVAGIVAADGDITGVAPGASLAAYKVLNNQGRGELNDILAALEDIADPANAYEVDVVNMSLSAAGDENSPLSVAASEVVQAGIVVVSAAGNSGPGKQTVTAPASAIDVIAVGASTSGVTVPEIRIANPVDKAVNARRLEFSANPPENPLNSEVVDVGDGDPDDYEDVDVTGKTVLVTSGRYDEELAAFAEEKGAISALFYKERGNGPVSVSKGEIADPDAEEEKNVVEWQHTFPTGHTFDIRLDKLVAVEIDQSTAKEIKSYLAEQSVTLSMTAADATDTMPEFSSLGPTTGNLYLKPDITAPGVEIQSTVPASLYGEDYFRMSGTSMASPHVAGSAALIKQLHQKDTPEEIASALVNTAEALDDTYDTNAQGSGRLNVHQAAQTNVLASPRNLSFGVADVADDQIQKRKSVTLTNQGDKEMTFNLDVKADLPSEVAVTLEPSSVSIPAGGKQEVNVEITADRPEVDTDYTGWIEAESTSESDQPNLRIPFYLSIRFLQVHVSPDPAFQQSEAFIYSPVALSEHPTVTVVSPSGESTEMDAEHDNDLWWRVPIEVEEPGIYHIMAAGTTEEDIQLIGNRYMESLAGEKDIGWKPVGPNGMAGNQLFNLSDEQWATIDTEQPGMFLSTNGMTTWKEIRNFPMAGGKSRETVVDPLDPNTMYVAIDGGSDPAYRGKVIVTTNGGDTWHTLPFPDVEITDLTISSTGKTIVASSADRLHISTNRGEDWKDVSGNWTGVKNVHISESKLFFSASDGLYVIKDFETNSGIAKQMITLKNGTGKLIAGDKDLMLFTGYIPNQLYASRDGGETWEIIKDEKTGISLLTYTDGKIFMGTLSNTSISYDKGETWEAWEKPLPSSSIHDVVLERNDGQPQRNLHAYIASSFGGVFETNDNGASYERLGAPGAIVHDVLVTEEDDSEYIIAGTDWDTYRTEAPVSNSIQDSNLEWGASGSEGYTGRITKLLDTSGDESNIIYKVNQNAISQFLVYKSEDGGKTWEHLTTGAENSYAMLVHPADPERIYISYWALVGSGILVSEDGGENWAEISRDQPAQTLVGDPDNPDKLWLGDNSGLYLSEDGGSSFTQMNEKPISSIALGPENPEHLILGGRELYHSYDGGKTIVTSNYTDLSLYITDLLFSTKDPNTVYASTGSFKEAGLIQNGRGVLRSNDGGKSWENFSGGLPNKNTTSLDFSADEKYLYSGTNGGSVYRINITKIQQAKEK